MCWTSLGFALQCFEEEEAKNEKNVYKFQAIAIQANFEGRLIRGVTRKSKAKPFHVQSFTLERQYKTFRLTAHAIFGP